MKTKSFEVVVKLAFLLCLLMTSTAGATSYTLTVSAQGSGTVTKNPTNAAYPSGVTVIVTATPDTGWYFENWSGDATGTNNPLNVTMNSNMVITGNFLPFPTYTLSLNTYGQGTIVLNPAGGSYLSNSVVSATATPASGWVFTFWSGDTNSNANPLSLTVNSNISLTGSFAQLPAFDLQPFYVTNAVGGTVRFSAHATGTAPLEYQWLFGGSSLTNATNGTLSLTNVSAGQAGNYWIVASNNYGSATSSVVLLTLTNISGSTNVVHSPDESSLRAAIKIGGWVSLGFSGTVTITNTINITNNVILDGSGVSAVISGGSAVRLFYVAPGVTFSLTNVILANGSCIVTNGSPGTPADAGAIYNDGGTVNLFSCTVTNDSAQSLIFGGLARGGAIFNNGGSVYLFQSAISNNAAIGGGPNSPVNTATTGTGLGGAIYNTNGTVTISSCNVSSNFCNGIFGIGFLDTGTSLAMGGAMYQSSGFLAITNSLFLTNLALGGNGVGGSLSSLPGQAYGGALAVNGGTTIINHSQFISNIGTGGNAIYKTQAGAACGGAIFSAAVLTVIDSSFLLNQSIAGNYGLNNYNGVTGAGGFGGAIYNVGTALLNRCSVFSNYVQGGAGNFTLGTVGIGGNGLGGGIFNASQFAATNCTIALNSVIGGNSLGGYGTGTSGNAWGGGIFNSTNATFIAMNLTIASNSCSSPFGSGFTSGIAAGSEIANTNGTLRLHNSLVAYGGTNGNAYGIITDDGYNICSDGTAQLFGGSSYNYTDPQLGLLADNGGPTLCIALLPTSPAIDSADPANFPSTDQRGYVRPIGASPDMGAYEYGSYPLSLNIIASTANNIIVSFTASPTNSYRLQASTNLLTWTDLNTNGPFAISTNITQTISKQGLNLRFFRLLMQ